MPKVRCPDFGRAVPFDRDEPDAPVACAGCGGRFVPRDAAAAIPADRPTPRRRSPCLWLTLAGGAVVLAVACCGGVLFLGAALSNAKCPDCGQEFYIDDQHRHDADKWAVGQKCPRCGRTWPYGHYFDTYDMAHARKGTGAARAKLPGQ